MFRIILYEKRLFHVALFRYSWKKILTNWRRRMLAGLKFNIFSERRNYKFTFALIEIFLWGIHADIVIPSRVLCLREVIFDTIITKSCSQTIDWISIIPVVYKFLVLISLRKLLFFNKFKIIIFHKFFQTRKRVQEIFSIFHQVWLFQYLIIF